MAVIDAYGSKTRNWIKKTGDAMISGFLTLFQDPTDPLHAVTKQYVDNLFAGSGSGLDERLLGLHQQTGAGTGVNTVGLSGLTTNGGVSLLSDATGMYVNYLSAVGLSQQAGYSTTSTPEYTLALFPDIIATIKTGPNAADITNCRIWVGISQNTALGGATHNNIVLFRFNQVESGDTNWQCVTRGAGASATITDSGVAVSVDTRYIMRINVASLNTVQFYINNTLVATHTTDLPASLQTMNIACYLINGLAGTQRNFRVRRWQTHMR